MGQFLKQLLDIVIPGIIYDFIKEIVEIFIKKSKDIKQSLKSESSIIIKLIFQKYKTLIILFIGVIILSIFYFGFNEESKDSAEFTNKYVYGFYNGLIRKDNDTTTMQRLDCEFYISEKDRQKGNYIRVLVYPSEYHFLELQNYEKHEKWSYVKDVYDSVLISLCEEYDSTSIIKESAKLEYIENQNGVYIEIPNYYLGETNFKNTVLYDNCVKSNNEKCFVLQKCLYFGSSAIIVVVLTHNGTYENFIQDNTEDVVILRNCFQSFYQVLEEGSFQSY